MYNTKFVLSDGRHLYPGYLSHDVRLRLYHMFGSKKSYMYCGCSTDTKLYYRISKDLKIYPEKNEYVFLHSANCCRYRDSEGRKLRSSAYIIDDQSGEVMAYTNFNPKSFTIPIEREEPVWPVLAEEEFLLPAADDMVDEPEGDAVTDEKKGKKEPKFSLADLIRCINVDTYTDHVLNGRNIVSFDYFNKCVFYRLKKVVVKGMNKSLGSLSLQEDGMRFFYVPFENAVFEETDTWFRKGYLITRSSDGKEYKMFLYPKTLENAIDAYVKTYGCEPDEDTMAAGFQYMCTSKNGKPYKVIGRLHLFLASEIGIYSRSEDEYDFFCMLCDLCREHKDMRFFIPPDDRDICSIVEFIGIRKKIAFYTKTPKKIDYNPCEYVAIKYSNGTSYTYDFLKTLVL